MTKKLNFAVIITGFSGIVAQVLLIREIFVSFYGNELSIGMVISNWLLLESIGSFFIGRQIEKAKEKIFMFVIFTILFSISFIFMLYLARIIKILLRLPSGVNAGIPQILFSTFFLLLPVSLIHGALFTFGCKLYHQLEQNSEKEVDSISKGYIYETTGTAIGGVLITFLLIPFFNSFEIAWIVLILNLISCYLILEVKNFRDRVIKGISGFLSILFFLLLLGEYPERINKISAKHQWKGFNLIDYKNSIYGNISVIKEQGQFTVFFNGIPVIITPFPDISFIEDYVHFSAGLIHNPEKILIISGGAGGIISEILKYPSVKQIDYIELDPFLIKTLENLKDKTIKKELKSEKVKIYNQDGRFFIKNTEEKYDAILLGISSPSDLQTNRFFTFEFFNIARERLTDKGILVLYLPGSLSYLSEELKKINVCIMNTLKESFKNVKVIPGDFNIFIGTNSEIQINPEILWKNIVSKNIKTNLLTLPYLKYRFNSRWQEWFFKSIEGVKADINHDFKPVGVFFNISYWNSRFSPYFNKIFVKIKNLSPFIIPGIILILVLLIWGLYFYFKTHKQEFFSEPYIIWTTGFSGMLFHLVIIFGFQILFGYIYSVVGFLIAIFMTGVITGAIIIKNLLKTTNEKFLLKSLEVAIIFFSIILAGTFLFLKGFYDKNIIFLPFLFFLFSFISGFLLGAEFPVVSKIYIRKIKDLSKTAGILYSSDLMGGWFSGLTVSIIFIPILGIINTCVISFLLKISSYIIFLLCGIMEKKKEVNNDKIICLY